MFFNSVLFAALLSFAISANAAIIPALAETRVVTTNTMQQIYEEVKTPFKYGVALAGESTNKLVDSRVFFGAMDIGS